MRVVEASIIIRAPQPCVAAIYADFDRWSDVFPTIRGVRLLSQDGARRVLEIDHREGRVVNVLTVVSAEEVRLSECKRRYDGSFVNRFVAVPGGTCFTVAARISLKGIYRLAAPLVPRRYVRRQLITYVLEPIRRAAEERCRTLDTVGGRRGRAALSGAPR